MPNADRHILSIEGLGVSYGGVQAVQDVTLSVSPGEIVGLVGESGSGKSSILRAVCGLLGKSGAIDAGNITFDGVDTLSLSLNERRRLAGHRIAFVFQDAISSLDPLFTVAAQFDECLIAHLVAHNESQRGRSSVNHLKSAMREKECAVLREVGLDDPDRVLASYPHNLSGGMCQRVALAMAVACEPALLLADEPTSALDVTAQRQVSELMLRIRRDHGTAMLVVSHNIGAISLIADRIGVMYRGRLVELGERDQVLHEPVHPYTRNLIAAVPRTDGSLPRVPDPWEGE